LLRRILFFIAVFLISYINAKAQSSGYTFLTWDNISLGSTDPELSDTNIIIITNRKFDPQSKKFFLTNEVDPEGKLRFIVASCKENQWKVCFRESFKEAMQFIQVKNDFLFLVHGDGKTFPDLLDRCIRTERLYSLNLVVFDWPSRIPDYSRMRNFFNSKRNAKKSVNGFKEALMEFDNYTSGNKKEGDTIHYSLFVHSLGNRILKAAVENNLDSSIKMKFDNVIMNAPAVQQKKHKAWVGSMGFQKRIYITSNQKDRTLYGAHLITFRRQLGEKLRKPLAKNANYINFRNLVNNKHNYYLDLMLFSEHPTIKDFYHSLFHGEFLDPENKSIFKIRKDGLGYDIL
jgi:esterase/lipase superfamily enzyme